MTYRRQRLRFYAIAYTLIALIAVGGLAVNIQTIPVNDAIQKMQIQVKHIQDENQVLKLKLLSESRLDVVDEIARSQLGMAPPDTIMFIKEKDKPNVFDHPTP